MLQTALVTITSGTTELRNCRILFDSCSQLSYVSPSIRERLHLETIDRKKISIKTFGNQCITENLEKVQFCVLDMNGARIPISCFVKDICAPINGQNIKFAIENYSHLKDLRLADSHFAEGNVCVDILIGADFYWSIVDNEIIRGIEGPVAIKSKVGFLLSGNIFGISDSCGVFHSHILEIASEFCNDKTVFHNSMSSLWDSETIGTTRSDINDLVYENFKNEIQFNKHSNRYEVGLPFKLNHDLISDNYTYCIKRLAPVLKKLSKDNKLLTSYNAIIKEQLTQGVIEKVNNHEISYGDVHYLPHRPVIRDDKSTTKVLMVFDASATIDGPSLNDCLNAGPSLTTSLFGVLLRFRCNKYAFISDIEKAFLQISLKEKDRDFVRFLWVDNLDSVNGQDLLSSPIVTYRLCRVLFGVTSSPFLLSATLVTHLQKYTESDQEFVEKMLLSLHVDDLNSGSNDLNQCLEFFNKARNYLPEANFNLRKFESNSVELEQKIQSNNYERNNTTKVLGQAWDKDLDELTYSFNDILETVKKIPSKILSDNGTQFVAELTQLFASNKSIDWQFNVPAAPWWGGLFERMIRMVKRCLKKVVGKARLNYEQMLTLLQEIETVINNRPLTFVYNEPCVEALTPNHLVFGRKLNLNGVNSGSNIEHDLNKRYNHFQTVLEHLIKRWKSEYLTELREFHKSKRSIGSVQINIGDIVLIEEDKKSRLLWKTAKVEKILASSDGCSRAATVNYLQGDGSFRHVNKPINKLVPVEYANQKEGINQLKLTFVNENDIPLVIKH